MLLASLLYPSFSDLLEYYYILVYIVLHISLMFEDHRTTAALFGPLAPVRALCCFCFFSLSLPLTTHYSLNSLSLRFLP